MRSMLSRYRYEGITAVSGAVVMILELVGARMIAPYFGTSFYVWTAMIGVILGALSLGYWYGGRIADKHPNDLTLMKIIVLAALAILACLFFQEYLLAGIAGLFEDVRFGALLAAVLLFAPAALLLGVVSPYVARLRLDNLASAGQSIGRLYAAGTFGSIVGTFLAGYWLIAWFGNRTLGFSLVIVLLLLSCALSLKSWRLVRAVVGVAALYGMMSLSLLSSNVIADVDSAYSRYLVTESDGTMPVRALIMDPYSTQSAQYVDQPDILISSYTQRFKYITDQLRPQDVLVVGGGAYTFPSVVARSYPATTVDVVEIDPALTDIATTYFNLEKRKNLHITHMDGRVFLNRATKKYDVIFMDAFSSLTPPYQLTTIQALQHEQRILTNRGVVVANVVARLEDDPYLSSVVASYEAVFTEVDVYRIQPDSSSADRQNLLVVASDDGKRQREVKAALGYGSVSVEATSPLTDDYAPVEQLINSR